MTQALNMTNNKDSHFIRIGTRGRISIPVFIRKRLDLKTGDRLLSWVEGNKLVLKPFSVVEQELWTIYKESNISSDKLIKERREESKREGKK